MPIAIGGPVVTPFVVDYSAARPGGAAIKAAGAVGVIRYTGARNDGVAITHDEYQDLVAHGLQVGIAMEFAANWSSGGYNAGFQNAQFARAGENVMGIPPGVTYCAVDWDVTLGGPPQSAQAVANCEAVLACCHGMADAYGGWEFVGIYGSKWICEWIAAHSPITKLWSTDAWSNYVPANGAALMQAAAWPQGVPLIGGCDYNKILRSDWGARTTEDDMTPDQANQLKTIAGAVYQMAMNDAKNYAALKAELDAIKTELEAMKAAQGPGNTAILEAVKAVPAGTGGAVDPAAIVAAIKQAQLTIS